MAPSYGSCRGRSVMRQGRPGLGTLRCPVLLGGDREELADQTGCLFGRSTASGHARLISAPDRACGPATHGNAELLTRGAQTFHFVRTVTARVSLGKGRRSVASLVTRSTAARGRDGRQHHAARRLKVAGIGAIGGVTTGSLSVDGDAACLYVSPAGNDDSDGRTWASAKRQISSAVSSLGRSDG